MPAPETGQSPQEGSLATIRAVPAASVDLPRRPEVDGKFFRRGSERLYLRGVTYGPFAPGSDGHPYDPARVGEDFARMAAAGINTVRLYTPPPVWLLDAALQHRLGVLAGVAWEQHVTFLDDGRRAREIVGRVRAEIAERAGHEALMAWAVGNEIPSPIVRWHGPGRMSAYIERLYDAAKEADPGAAVTYVNYPTTEYLGLDFLDFACFNVFLEQPDTYAAYLRRLQNIAGDRPLVLTEIGLDSRTHGLQRQADTIDWQVRGAFAGGCAGTFAFAWTDEWHRGGVEITDWEFGLTDRQRHPKPALTRLSTAYSEVPLPEPPDPPRVSVLVCTYNGARTLRATCEAVSRLRYPNFEVIVVDDGSTDTSAEIARSFGFSVISTENRGLSNARNTALSAASGEIVAYIDDDAMPDPHWLTYLVEEFRRTDFVAVGGPNLAVPGDGIVADAVACSPGNPIHVLLDDHEAEHIPGCNSAFRTEALRSIGGFDPRFTTAGDDVDVCWRLQDAGGRIGYCAPAFVWHHRRGTLSGYLRQQRGYGRAEAMLERKWPARYSPGGHVTWTGRVYGPATSRHPVWRWRWRVYHGVWNTAPFQFLYAPSQGDMNTVLLMPELYLGIGFLSLIVALGVLWTPLLACAPLPLVLAGVLALRSIGAARASRFPTPGLDRAALARRYGLTALLHIAQPLVRLEGRLRHGLTPWRLVGSGQRIGPRHLTLERWSEVWVDPAQWLRALERGLLAEGVVVRRGGDFDAWDVEVAGGMLAGVRILTALEEHGSGRQLLRARLRPRFAVGALLTIALLLALAAAAAADGGVAAAVLLALLGLGLSTRTLQESALARGVSARVLLERPPGEEPAEREAG